MPAPGTQMAIICAEHLAIPERSPVRRILEARGVKQEHQVPLCIVSTYWAKVAIACMP